MSHFQYQSDLEQSKELVFSWHEQAGAFRRLCPPWENIRLRSGDASLSPGSKKVIEKPIGPFSLSWEAEHTEYEKNVRFVDVQNSGPFQRWKHEHLFEELQ